MSCCIIYLASPRDFVTGSGHSRYEVLKASLKITRRLLPDMNVYVFHEDYTEEDKNGLPDVTQFITVDFSGFENIYDPSVGSPRGYLMMCRFFSGVVQKHPVLQPYSHYIRLDDDSYFMEPYLTHSQVQSLLANDYVFRAMFNEVKPQKSLGEFTLNFVSKLLNPIKFLQLKRSLIARKFLTESGEYTGLAPYNNFHLSSLRLWNHPLIQRYIDAIEESGGIFRYGWLDANIHAMIMYIFPYIIPGLSIKPVSNFGYRHNIHVCYLGTMNAICDETLPFYPNE